MKFIYKIPPIKPIGKINRKNDIVGDLINRQKKPDPPKPKTPESSSSDDDTESDSDQETIVAKPPPKKAIPPEETKRKKPEKKPEKIIEDESGSDSEGFEVDLDIKLKEKDIIEMVREPEQTDSISEEELERMIVNRAQLLAQKMVEKKMEDYRKNYHPRETTSTEIAKVQPVAVSQPQASQWGTHLSTAAAILAPPLIGALVKVMMTPLQPAPPLAYTRPQQQQSGSQQQSQATSNQQPPSNQPAPFVFPY